jgi:aqualysin 1
VLRHWILVLVFMQLVAAAPLRAQAIPCQPGTAQCDTNAPKLILDLNFDFIIKSGKPAQKVPRPTKIVKSKKSIPAPSPKPKAKYVKLQKPEIRKPIAQSPAPKQSWDGLPNIPVTVLKDQDMADIPNQFIVDFNLDAVKAGGFNLLTISQNDLATALGIAPSQIRSIQRRFLFSAVIKATPEQAAILAKHKFIKTVEVDTQIKAAGGQRVLSWGLDRLDGPALPLDGHFDRDFGDYQTRIYVFDTAVDQGHAEFGNRLKFGASFVKPIKDKSRKCREHGTEMASLIAGQTTGSAPKSEIVQLVVLPCEREQTGEASSLIEAAEWLLVREADHGDGKPVIANMSIAGKWSRKINQAVSVLTENQVAVVAAAGNNAQDACRFSPASAKDAITVAATGPKDETPGFSNFGSCVDIHAPGKFLTALTESSKDIYVASNGTSGATALVSGLLARSLKNKGPKAAALWLANASVPAMLWRKDQPDMLLAQVNPDIHLFCRVGKNTVKLLGAASNTSKLLKLVKSGAIVHISQVQQEWLLINTQGGAMGWISRSDLLQELTSESPCQAVH